MRITFFLLLTLCLFSCDLFQTDEYYYLSSIQKTNLVKGDTLVYSDNLNEKDTLFVFQSFISTYRRSLSGSDCKVNPSAYIEVNTIYFIRHGKESISAYCKGIDENDYYGDCENTYYCDDAIFVSIWSDGNNYPGIIWYGTPFRFKSVIDSIEISGNLYSNVFLFESSDLSKTDSISELYFSFKSGILKMSRINKNDLNILSEP